MYGDYGYMEEGQLGKAYNVRILRRLAHYAVPYKRMIVAALFLTIMITLLDLALPYLSKIAIDRYIVAAWYRVNLSDMGKAGARDFITTYGHILKMSKDASFGLVSHGSIKKIDPSVLHEYRRKGIISEKRFYSAPPDRNNETIVEKQIGNFWRMADESIVFPFESISVIACRY